MNIYQERNENLLFEKSENFQKKPSLYKETKLQFEKALEEGPIYNQNSETAKISTQTVDATSIAGSKRMSFSRLFSAARR